MRALVLAVLAAGCVTPLTTDGRPCPCDDGHACCDTGQGPPRCVRQEDLARLTCRPTASDAAADDVAAPATPPDGPLAAPRCRNGGGGLDGTYFASDDFQGTSFHRSEPALIFDSFSFLADRLPTDRFTAIFSGALVPETSDRYSFLAVTNGALRVWIGGELIIDAWDFPCCPRGLTAALPLEGGRRHDVLIEYFGVDRGTRLALYWRDSKSATWTAIPPCALFPRLAGPSACPAPFGDCVPPGTPACTIQDVNGVRATYYTTPDFTGPGKTQNENFISSGWLATSSPADARSVRWEADLVAPTRGTYTLYLAARGPTRLALEGRTLLDTGATPVMKEVEAEIDLVPFRHNRVVIQQSIDDNGFWIRLRWKSAGVPRATIPRCRFFLPPGPSGQYDGGLPGGDGGP